MFPTGFNFTQVQSTCGPGRMNETFQSCRGKLCYRRRYKTRTTMGSGSSAPRRYKLVLVTISS
jgi:hypothetical protein